MEQRDGEWVLVPVQTHPRLYIRTNLVDQGTKQGEFGKASHFQCRDGIGMDDVLIWYVVALQKLIFAFVFSFS